MKLQNYVIGILAVLLGPLLSPVSADVCMLLFYETGGEASGIAKGKNCKTELGTMDALAQAGMVFVESEESDDDKRLYQLASLDAVPLDEPNVVGELEKPGLLTLFNKEGDKAFGIEFPTGDKELFEEQLENMSHSGPLAASLTVHFPVGDDVYALVAKAYFGVPEGIGTSLQERYDMPVHDGPKSKAATDESDEASVPRKFSLFREEIWPHLGLPPKAFHMAITKPVIGSSVDVVSVVDMINLAGHQQVWRDLVSFFNDVGTFHVDTGEDFVMLCVEVTNFHAPQIEEETFDTAPMQNKNAHRRQTRKFRRKRRAHLRHVRRGRQAKRRTNPQKA